MDKEKLKKYCIDKIAEQLKALNTLISEVQTSSNQETKSTAGDKHDTSRAQAQIELERIGSQYLKLENTLKEAKRIPTHKTPTIQWGSLVESDCGSFYIAVPIGKIAIGSFECYAISVQSPLGKVLIGKSIDAVFNLPNGTNCRVLKIE